MTEADQGTPSAEPNEEPTSPATISKLPGVDLDLRVEKTGYAQSKEADPTFEQFEDRPDDN